MSEQESWFYQSTRANEEGSRFESDKLVGHQKLGGKREWDIKLVRRSDRARKEFIEGKRGIRFERDVYTSLEAWE